MIIYGALLSPFVRKVAVIAAEKGIETQLTAPRRRDGPNPDFAAISPFGKIPAIRDGDFTLADSTAIAVYLEAKHPAPPLLPAEAEARGRVMWFDEVADTIVAASGLKILFNRLVGPKFFGVPGDEAVAAEGEAELPRIYAYLESVAPAAGWLVGDAFTLADIAIASVLRSLAYVSVEPRPAAYPALCAWYGRVVERPSWRAVATEETKFRVPA